MTDSSQLNSSSMLTLEGGEPMVIAVMDGVYFVPPSVTISLPFA